MPEVNRAEQQEQNDSLEVCDFVLNAIYKASAEFKKGPDGELTELPNELYEAEAKVYRAQGLLRKGYNMQQVKKAIPNFTQIMEVGLQLAQELESK